ncbi:MAG: circularly permuted type 2 ATP-grasp protein [Planctomycetota bacterium]
MSARPTPIPGSAKGGSGSPDSPATVPSTADSAITRILDSYRPRSAYDEWVDSAGKPRSSAARVIAPLFEAGVETLDGLLADASRLVRQSEANFLLTKDVANVSARPWQLGFPPLTMDLASWRSLRRGLAQRTRVIEAVLQDLLGPRNLIRQGIIPAELLTANNVFFRAYRGLTTGKQHLFLSAVDLARDHQGQWWVTGDRTRAPSGLGFAIENRILTNRILPDRFDRQHIRRLAPFFSKLRAALEEMRPHGDHQSRTVLLTPGSRSYRYTEDAYLARYLNLILVQGDDLAVRNDRLNLKTLSGTLPIDVVWRHVDDHDCDPLELAPQSRSGATGMVGLVRTHRVAVANSLGSILGEMPALRGYLNSASKMLFDQPLELPSIETYWCGDPRAMANIQTRREQMIYSPAHRVTGEAPIDPSKMSREDRERFFARMAAAPGDWIATTRAQRSTTAVWTSGGLKSSYVALRTYQLQSGDSIEVMPGGLTRVAKEAERLDYSPHEGRFGIDTWIVDDRPVDEGITLLSNDKSAIALTRGGDELPSRVAENFFWIARTIERIDLTSRVLRVLMRNMRDANQSRNHEVVRRMVHALAAGGQLPPDYAIDDLSKQMPELIEHLPRSLVDETQPVGLFQTVQTLNWRAVALRDRISIDAYTTLMDMVETTQNAKDRDLDFEDAVDVLSLLIRGCNEFAGLTAEVMTRTQGWRFLELGRRIERGIKLASFLRSMIVQPSSDSTEHVILEAVLRATDSIMTYRSRYLMQLAPVPVIDLLVTDLTNPRSIAFQIRSLEKCLRHLPGQRPKVTLATEQRIVENLMHRFRMAQAARLGSGEHRQRLQNLLGVVEDKLPKLSKVLTAHYLSHSEISRDLLSYDELLDPTTGLD